MDIFKVTQHINRVRRLIPRARQALRDAAAKEAEEQSQERPNLLDFTNNYYSRKPSNGLITPNSVEKVKDSGNMTGQPALWDLYVPEDSSWARKTSNAPWATNASNNAANSRNNPNTSAAKLQEYKKKRRKLFETFNTGRLTGKVKIRKSSIENLDKLDKQVHLNEPEGPHFGSQFKEYCSATSLHGYRYIAEKKRNPIERTFWLGWCLFGICAAAYMMSKIWTKWEKNPVITSVATTNFPVSNIVFPAVTICTVNKASTEKLIIQACRYNFSLSQMKTIISVLVDPDARNNDHFNVDKITVKPEIALKYLRLVAPKCDDYLLSCRWNSAPALCTQLFRLVLTDSGYCCTFNSIETKRARKDSKHDLEVQIQEQEYDYLQRAVWEYTDQFRGKSKANEEGGSDTVPVDNFNCVREYDDDLFPGICAYLDKCRGSAKCREKNKAKSNATTQMPIGSAGSTQPLNFFAESFPLKVAGAGRSRGLTLMLDTLRCDTVPTDSFKGLRVLVHNADDFPAVAERGYIVGPGMETQIGVTATDTYSKSVLRGFSATTRGCFFPDEFPLKFYKEYSRSACVIECETEFINQECQCVTYYSPGNYSVCGLKKYLECVKKAIDVIQKKTLPVASTTIPAGEKSMFNFKTKEAREQDQSCTQMCLPSCNETFYNVFVTAADFPNQPQPNQTKMLREAIVEGGHVHLNDINYVSGSISVLRIFFRESSIMQYKRDELFTWEDFVSNLGGVMGLCMGFSLLSLVEVVYFFSMRMLIEKRKFKTKRNTAEVVISDPPGPHNNFKHYY